MNFDQVVFTVTPHSHSLPVGQVPENHFFRKRALHHFNRFYHQRQLSQILPCAVVVGYSVYRGAA